MKTKLITALRTAAKALEDGTFAYNWKYPQSCNCGIIASTLMNKSISQLEQDLHRIELPKGGGIKTTHTWRNIISHHCPVTGLSTNSIIRSMQEAGMTQSDIVQLEDLSNPEVLKRMNLGTKPEFKITGQKLVPQKEPIPRSFWQWLTRRPVQYREFEVAENVFGHVDIPVTPKREKKEHTILYMRAWADLLTEQGKEDCVETPAVLRQSPDKVGTTK